VKESRDPVRAALHRAQFEFPACRITVSLAPPTCLSEGRAFVLPEAGAHEPALVRDAVVYPAVSPLAVCAHLTGRDPIERCVGATTSQDDEALPATADLRGQGQAKRALEVLREPIESGVIHISRAARQASLPARTCEPDSAGADWIQAATSRVNLSARANHRILRVARTIADLAAVTRVGAPHVAEAIGCRRFDRALPVSIVIAVKRDDASDRRYNHLHLATTAAMGPYWPIRPSPGRVQPAHHAPCGRRPAPDRL